jgi:hypothetical protein
VPRCTKPATNALTHDLVLSARFRLIASGAHATGTASRGGCLTAEPNRQCTVPGTKLQDVADAAWFRPTDLTRIGVSRADGKLSPTKCVSWIAEMSDRFGLRHVPRAGGATGSAAFRSIPRRIGPSRKPPGDGPDSARRDRESREHVDPVDPANDPATQLSWVRAGRLRRCDARRPPATDILNSSALGV